MSTASSVPEQIIAHAMTPIMRRGYNGFSYRDLSALAGVKTSSIHYYFPAKDDLVLETAKVYSTETLAALNNIDGALPADLKLTAYANPSWQRTLRR